MTDKEPLGDATDDQEGVLVQAVDGRLFFIPANETSWLEIPHSALYSAYLSVNTQPQIVQGRSSGAKKKAWLDSHSPNRAKWRKTCNQYFDHCV